MNKLFVSFLILACFSFSSASCQERVYDLFDRMILIGEKVNRSATQKIIGLEEPESLCVLTETGKIFCAGNKEHGQLGRPFIFNTSNKEANYASPSELLQPDLPRGAYFVDIAPRSGNNFGDFDSSYCALDQFGNLFCWGKAFQEIRNLYRKPVFMNPSGVQFESLIFNGDTMPCAISTAGVPFCFPQIYGKGFDPSNYRMISVEEPVLTISVSSSSDRYSTDYCAVLKRNKQVVCHLEPSDRQTQGSGAGRKSDRKAYYTYNVRAQLNGIESNRRPSLLPNEVGLPSEPAREDSRISKLRGDLQRKRDEMLAHFSRESDRLTSCLTRISSSSIDKFGLRVLDGSIKVLGVLRSASFSGYGWSNPEDLGSLEPSVDISYEAYAVAGRVDQWGQFVYQLIRAVASSSGNCEYSTSAEKLPHTLSAENLFGKNLTRPVEHLSTTLSVNYSDFTEKDVNTLFGGNVIAGFRVSGGVYKHSVQIRVRSAGDSNEILSKVIELIQAPFYPLR